MVFCFLVCCNRLLPVTCPVLQPKGKEQGTTIPPLPSSCWRKLCPVVPLLCEIMWGIICSWAVMCVVLAQGHLINVRKIGVLNGVIAASRCLTMLPPEPWFWFSSFSLPPSLFPSLPLFILTAFY